MPVEEMGVDDRREYLSRMKKRYDAAGRIERAGLLDEMEQVTEMHRKSLIRLLSRHDLSREPRLKERGREYGTEVDDAIRVIAESLDFVCAERLTPALPEMARHLFGFGEMQATPQLIDQLERITVATDPAQSEAG